MPFCHKNIKKKCCRGNSQLGHFFARIIDYVLVDSFWGCPGFIDNPTSSTTMAKRDIHYHRHDYQRLQHSLADIIFSMVTIIANLECNCSFKNRNKSTNWYKGQCSRIWLPKNWQSNKQEFAASPEQHWKFLITWTYCLGHLR